MRFPFIYRKDHEEQVRLLNLVIHEKDNRIADQNAAIAILEAQNAAFIEQLSTPAQPESPAGRRRTKTLASKPSWRSLAQKSSQTTIKATGDSAAQLEERVKQQGGSV